jgi:hypothetical protein
VRFSERHGFVAPRDVLQLESMDEALRASLWNVVQETVWGKHKSQSGYSYTKHSNLFCLITRYWKDYFKVPINDIPQNINDAIDSVKNAFLRQSGMRYMISLNLHHQF